MPAASCVKKPDNGLNTTCGSAGNACVNCAESGSTCNPSTNTCANGGTGGGSGGGTGGGPGWLHWLPSPDEHMRSSCEPDAEQLRQGRRSLPVLCRRSDLQRGCSRDASADGDHRLALHDGQRVPGDAWRDLAVRRKQTNGGSAYAGGYCTIPCGQVAGTCPAASTCVGGVEELGEGTFCWKNCTPGAPSAARVARATPATASVATPAAADLPDASARRRCPRRQGRQSVHRRRPVPEPSGNGRRVPLARLQLQLAGAGRLLLAHQLRGER